MSDEDDDLDDLVPLGSMQETLQVNIQSCVLLEVQELMGKGYPFMETPKTYS